MAKMLIDGQLCDKPESGDGRFNRQNSAIGHWVQWSPESRFPAEPARYHLFVSMACPWCHRVMIARRLKGLEDVISVSHMVAETDERGWRIAPSSDPVNSDIAGDQFMYEVYLRGNPNYSGPVTVPVLWDKRTQTIISNESADIMRMLNSSFADYANNDVDLYPPALRAQIDAINAFIHETINNGVYRCGFARTQAAYDEAVVLLFNALDAVEQRLSCHSTLVGDVITEADWRLFVTLVRFDPVYVTHFKTDRKRIADYPSLSAYLNRLHQVPGVAQTIDMAHIRQHYFRSHLDLNPLGIIPVGPAISATAQTDGSTKTRQMEMAQ